MLQGDEAGEITRREHVSLLFAEDDFDLIEPTGVRGQPIEVDLKGQF